MRIAVVTGASSGIGEEFSRQIPRLYKKLDELWIVSRNDKKLNQLKNDLEIKNNLTVRVCPYDLTKQDALDELEQQFSTFKPEIRMLVNAAGMGKMGNVSEVSPFLQNNILDINCKALVYLTRICIPYMSKGSRVLNVASASAFAPQPGFAVYAASKSFVYSFSRALGAELYNDEIIVTAVCPGPVDTPFFSVAGEIKESKKRLLVRPEAVVKQALLDCKNKRAVSIYGIPMKISRMTSAIIPDKVLMAAMKYINDKK